MDVYLTLKLIHIFAATVVMGTGTGIAFFMFMASRSNNAQAVYMTARHVVLGDWLFTTPGVIIQVISGVWLMNILGFSFDSIWFYTVAGLYGFIGLCWLPVVIIQYRLRALAKADAAKGELSAEFKQLMRRWTLLGIPAFSAMLVIFYLMVFKPLPVV